MSSHRFELLQTALLASTIFVAASCAPESSTGLTESYDVQLSIAAEMPAGFQLSAVPLIPDSAYAAVLRASSGEILAEAGASISIDGEVPPLVLAFQLAQPTEPVRITVQILAGGTPLLGADEGRVVVANQTNDVASLTLGYVGPGASIRSLLLEPADSVLTFGESLQMRATGLDAQGTPVNAGLYLVWSTDDPDVGVSFDWNLEAPGNRRTVTIRGRHVGTGAEGTTVMTFQPPASALSAPNSSATAFFGSSPQLDVRAVANDGLGVRSVPVQFRKISGPGSVSSTPIYTDAGGFARTNVSIGSTPGIAVYEATAPGLAPVRFTIDVVNPARVALSPSSLTFATSEGFDPSPNVQSVVLTNAGGSTMPWTAVPSKPWIAVSASSGTLAPGQAVTLDVTVSGSTLPAGLQSGSVLITGSGALNSPRKVPVQVTVAPRSRVRLSIGSLSFSTTVGSNPTNASQSFSLTNSGTGVLDWKAEKGSGWLTLSTASGSLIAGQSTSIRATVASAGLAEGTYTDTIRILDASTGAVLGTLVVTLTVNRPGPGTHPQISLSPGQITISTTVGGPPANRSLTLDNTGGADLNWTAQNASSWLQLGSTSGTLLPGASTTIQMQISPAGLSAGTYTDTIRVSDAQATNSPQLSVITLQVSTVPSGSSPTISNPVWVLNAVNDAARCSAQSPAGSHYTFTVDYSDPDGDVNASSILENYFIFQGGGPQGAEFLVAGSQFTITGDGSSGQLTLDRCTVFGASTSVTNEFVLVDAAGNRSKAIVTSRSRPTGANSTTGGAVAGAVSAPSDWAPDSATGAERNRGTR